MKHLLAFLVDGEVFASMHTTLTNDQAISLDAWLREIKLISENEEIAIVEEDE